MYFHNYLIYHIGSVPWTRRFQSTQYESPLFVNYCENLRSSKVKKLRFSGATKVWCKSCLLTYLR